MGGLGPDGARGVPSMVLAAAGDALEGGQSYRENAGKSNYLRAAPAACSTAIVGSASRARIASPKSPSRCPTLFA